ncbi:hypothetical protein CHGG_05622 [Chaetomium globosum CBS 148.51]|uniref:Uncharacterized protein n=1 Tax=Chaetomium globosum (strain ATCC 6205 / CBS 148.51 / DSM 1962 / NBRC 6347 / NRRL 1970) TaxID=306901 RepID=Q2H6U3_CHAGB|nr:uncharacterized protein CHGG_05622 [Chaetomium globosum CBS 148.51]EAQ89003.1 hypothetical protein CHGG_05622 [Chaetomium globosum CBS 148.51]
MEAGSCRVSDTGSHAGLSAFVNTPTDEEETRHARMIAVGVLVPLSYGRLGRAWRHAEGLKDMAAKLAADRKQTKLLDEYWENHGVSETTAPQPLKDTPLESPLLSIKASRPGLGKGHARNRSASDGTALIPPGHRLSPFHPAWSLTSLLDTFGPLIFPIQRAALLRKRILISCHAPVHEVCNFACTTDSILAMKEGLWDMLITMPPPHSSSAKQRVWPTVECPKGVPVKATQRDLRRFRSLTLGLARLATHPPTQPPPNPRSPPSETSDSPVPTTPAIRLSKPAGSRPGTAAEDRPSSLPTLGSGDDTDTIVEPATWAALAYNGFMWWASAGEKRHSDEVDEQSHDASLLADLAPPVSPAGTASSPSTQTRSQQPQPQPQQRRTSFGAAAAGSDMVSSLASLTAHNDDGDRGGDDRDDEMRARIELAAVAYFHRLTTSLLSVLADIVDSSDEDDLLGLRLDLREDAEPYSDYDGPAGARGAGAGAGAAGEEAARLLGGAGGGGEGGNRMMGWVRVDSEALAEMGLDVWSQADADFVGEVSARYFARRAYVETKGVEKERKESPIQKMAPDPSPPPNEPPPTTAPPPSSTTLTTTAASLAPALELLERFHHRNKNQHRLAKWWAQADMLRRQGLHTVVGGPAVWHTLGLMLLGVLAQVDQALTPFAAGPGNSSDVPDVRGEAASRAQSTGLSDITREDTVDRGLDVAMDVDMGVAVSREEVMLSIEQDTAPSSAPSRPAGQPHPRSISLPINPSKRKLSTQITLSKTEPPSKEGSTSPDPAKPKQRAKKAGNDEFDNIFGSSEEDTVPAATKSHVKKKAKPRKGDEESNNTTKNPPPDKARLQQKKKKTREDAGGDEFDDIFGSLDDGKSKKPKRKKRKKGDEFDDIFGGL